LYCGTAAKLAQQPGFDLLNFWCRVRFWGRRLRRRMTTPASLLQGIYSQGRRFSQSGG